MSSTNSRIRPSNLTTPTFPPPSVQNCATSPRMSFSMAIALPYSSLRAVSRARRFWLVSAFDMHGTVRVDPHHLRGATCIMCGQSCSAEPSGRLLHGAFPNRSANIRRRQSGALQTRRLATSRSSIFLPAHGRPNRSDILAMDTAR